MNPSMKVYSSFRQTSIKIFERYEKFKMGKRIEEEIIETF